MCSITIDIDNVNKVSKVNKVRIKRRLFNRITVVKVIATHEILGRRKGQFECNSWYQKKSEN